MPLVRFVAPTDPRMLSTLDAIRDERYTGWVAAHYGEDEGQKTKDKV